MSGDEFDAEFGAWIRTGRKAAHLTQERLSRPLGVHQTTLAKMEAGTRPVLASEAYRLAALLRQPLPDIFVSQAEHCTVCWGAPPEGFTCNGCGGAS